MSGEKLSLFASIPVNKRPRTDNEAVLKEMVTLITNKQISTGKLVDFAQLVKDMGVCGIVIGNNRIAGSVGFVESVFGKIHHFTKDVISYRYRNPLCHTTRNAFFFITVYKVFTFFLHNRRFFLTHGTSNQIASAKGIAS